MKEIIKITESNGKKAVSARELYDSLGYEKSQFSRWAKKNILENPYAIENEDWVGFDINVEGNLVKDYALGLDFSKKCCMLSKTTTGEKVRNYFIEVEKQVTETYLIPKTFSEALMLAANQAETIERQQKELSTASNHIKELAPKALFADAVSTSTASCLIGELSKILRQNGIEMGQNRLFDYLRKNGYLCQYGERYNQPTQKSMELELFEVKKTSINKPDGSILVTSTTKVTGKGQIYFVNKFLKTSV